MYIGGAALILSLAPLVFPASAAQQTAAQTSAPATSTAAPAKKTRKAPAKKSKKSRARAQTAPTPDRIREIQQALAKTGVYAAEPTGKWDAATTEAMKSFQASHGLAATGKLDARTLQKLGLGSETTGVAAPRPASDKTSSTPATSR